MRRIGTSDLVVPPLGLGLMRLDPAEAESRRVLAAALERGIILWDTADLYFYGQSEAWVGRVLKELAPAERRRVVVVTKGGNRFTPGEEGWTWTPDPAYIREAARASVRRLGVDAIDLYLLHGGTMADPIDALVEGLEGLVREGTIRHYGLSSIRPAVVCRALERGRFVAVMSAYGPLDRRPEREIVPCVRTRGASLIVRGVLAKGLLGRDGPRRIAALEAVGAHGYPREALLELYRQLEAIARETGDPEGSVARLAYRFVLAEEAVAVALIGARTVAQFEEAAGALDLPPLPPEAVARIRSLTRVDDYPVKG
ncbi:aldo/keto reductase [Hydrogenibacillus schlegelii]|uniref:NADP-dependent oxidoreductase domain-containing protein n=1 Tax=Hydrogenibacillus schlegelii TaxID=1484 RepID=A0A132MG48_HYDSH|nr:aldo/keto reductase [Hydrogenibacillus schlegelii]KWW96814.1 hypothetical protein TR75_12000 [Hydrogenibacillus schlegelii]OAR04753.1 hypothetical protein SA87_09615 [Hydrogenibacillus schlegelii]